jgi:hypothetical protein
MPRQHRYELIAVAQHVIQRGNNRLFPQFLLKRIIIAILRAGQDEAFEI